MGSSNDSKSSHSMLVFSEDHAPPCKKARTQHAKTIVDASHFLLNPLSAARRSPSSSSLGSVSSMGSPDLLMHLLKVEVLSFLHAFAYVPCRLQLLTSARGGTEEHHIADTDPFTEDEIEGPMCSSKEVKAIHIAMGWGIDNKNVDMGGGARTDSGNTPTGAVEGQDKKWK